LFSSNLFTKSSSLAFNSIIKYFSPNYSSYSFTHATIFILTAVLATILVIFFISFTFIMRKKSNSITTESLSMEVEGLQEFHPQSCIPLTQENPLFNFEDNLEFENE
jgi:hypothetical protein